MIFDRKRTERNLSVSLLTSDYGDLKVLKFIIDEKETSGAVEHLCVFHDERTEWIYVPENTGKLAEYRTCKAANPGKKGPEIIECLKERVKSDFVEE